jgi:hypothetical protein
MPAVYNRVVLADFREKGRIVPDGSVVLVLTDRFPHIFGNQFHFGGLEYAVDLQPE